MRNGESAVVLLSTLLVTLAGCKSTEETANPTTGDNLLGPMASHVDSGAEEFGGGATLVDDGKSVDVEPRDVLEARPALVERCKTTGRGRYRKQECVTVDPNPQLSATHGIYILMGDFRWGMSPSQVFKLLSRDIETEYGKRRDAAGEKAVAQDEARRWRADQLERIRTNYVRFTRASRHRWGVSLIQHEYEDDAGEGMIWMRTGNGLRKFFFFKNGALWKILYAYNNEVWPGKSYEDIVEEKFKRWFGIEPEEKVKQHPETGEPLLRYNEWTDIDGDIVRSFNLTSVHGVVALTVVDGATEAQIGERLPNAPHEENFDSAVENVLGGSDVCYNPDGTIRTCTEAEAMGFEPEE